MISKANLKTMPQYYSEIMIGNPQSSSCFAFKSDAEKKENTQECHLASKMAKLKLEHTENNPSDAHSIQNRNHGHQFTTIGNKSTADAVVFFTNVETVCKAPDSYLDLRDKCPPYEFDCDLTSPCSSFDEDEDDSEENHVNQVNTNKSIVSRTSTVRFAACPVTEIHYIPSTTSDDLNQYYDGAHEFHRVNYEMQRKPQKCIITAEEEDLDFW